MTQAEIICFRRGVKLTPKRKIILNLLLTAPTPPSAYEIADMYRQQTQQNMPVMSVYRILNFLMQVNLVHKLSVSNKFIVCNHISCADDEHGSTQFLICDNCESIREIQLDKNLINALRESVDENQFQLKNPQLEMHGLCKGCQKI